MTLLSNDRSFPHRIVSNFYTQLRVKELERERLQIFSALTGEKAVANRIGELESGILFSQPDQDTSFDEQALASLISSSESSSAAATTHQNENLFDFCVRMQISYNQVQGAVQERALGLLRHQIASHPETKSALVNYGALVGAVQAMRQFPRRPRLQGDATACLLHLMTVNAIQTEDSSSGDDNKEILEIGILRFMKEQGGFELMLQAVEQNRYQVNFFDDGFIQNYARRMAWSQIPEVLRFVQSSCHVDTAGISDVALLTLQNKVRFLKTCFATLLDDEGISKTTLMSSLPSF
mmetsp:Transcript_18056/g.34499  ORF Transcript_18056/g.34499 Transcript_18056/m.34499 type:complete len:294 (-) Transcript_18056:85-966(-)